MQAKILEFIWKIRDLRRITNLLGLNQMLYGYRKCVHTKLDLMSITVVISTIVNPKFCMFAVQNFIIETCELQCIVHIVNIMCYAHHAKDRSQIFQLVFAVQHFIHSSSSHGTSAYCMK